MSTLANLEQIDELVIQGAHFFVSHSGGKDSQAMYAAITKRVPHSQVVVIHADLGDIEWPGVQRHIHETTHHQVLIAKARDAAGNDIGLFDMIRRRRATLDSQGKTDAPAWPSSCARYCTSDLKTGPIWRVIRNAANLIDCSIVVNCVGIRGEESVSRARKISRKGTLLPNAKNTNLKRKAYDWWPIAHWSLADVLNEVRSVGQELHVAYANGNERLSCMFCIFGSDNDLQLARIANPALYRQYVELETEVRGTMFNGASIRERAA